VSQTPPRKEEDYDGYGRYWPISLRTSEPNPASKRRGLRRRGHRAAASLIVMRAKPRLEKKRITTAEAGAVGAERSLRAKPRLEKKRITTVAPAQVPSRQILRAKPRLEKKRITTYWPISLRTSSTSEPNPASKRRGLRLASTPFREFSSSLSQTPPRKEEDYDLSGSRDR